MTEAEREALEWLEDGMESGLYTRRTHSATLKAMLAGAGYHVPPKTKFGVSAGMGWVHFETLDEAMAAAKTELAGGNEVQIRAVPA